MCNVQFAELTLWNTGSPQYTKVLLHKSGKYKTNFTKWMAYGSMICKVLQNLQNTIQICWYLEQHHFCVWQVMQLRQFLSVFSCSMHVLCGVSQLCSKIFCISSPQSASLHPNVLHHHHNPVSLSRNMTIKPQCWRGSWKLSREKRKARAYEIEHALGSAPSLCLTLPLLYIDMVQYCTVWFGFILYR